MGSYGVLMRLCGALWGPYEDLWGPMGFYGALWGLKVVFMGSYGVLWGPYGVLWGPMGSYGAL